MRPAPYVFLALSYLACSACGRVAFRNLADASHIEASSSDAGMLADFPAIQTRDAAFLDGLDALALDGAASTDQRSTDDTLDAWLDASANADVEPDVTDATRSATDAQSPDADASPPDFAIIDPAPPQATTDDPRVLIRGTCAADLTDLAGSGLVDSDCSDGTWSASITIDPQSAQGATVGVGFSATRRQDAGNQRFSANLAIELVPIPIVIDEPARTSTAFIAAPSVVIAGSCAPDVTNLSTTLGIFADADCSDQRWSLETIAAGEGTVLSVIVRGERLSRAGRTIAGQDEIQVVLDRTAPGPLGSPSIGTANFSDDNFPFVRYVAPTSFNPSGSAAVDRGLCVLATDASCTNIVGAALCQAGRPAGGGLRGEFYPWVPDNSVTTFYGQVADLAGNASACVPIGTYTEVTAVERPNVCDVTLASDMTASEFSTFWTSLRAQADTFRVSEGHVLVCIEPTVVITLPTRTDVDIPGLYLRGLRGPGDSLPTCTLDSAPGTCARLISSSQNQFIVNGGDITFENLALEDGQLSLALGAATAGREFRNFVVRSPGFGVIHSASATGRWVDCSIGGIIGFAGLGSSTGSMERTHIRASGGFILDRTVFGRFSDNVIESNVAFSVQGDVGFYSHVERNLIRLTGPNASVLNGRSFAFTEAISFFRSDRFDYSVCRMPGASIAAVRADASYRLAGAPIPFRANTTGFGGPIGMQTFPDPRSTFDCP